MEEYINIFGTVSSGPDVIEIIAGELDENLDESGTVRIATARKKEKERLMKNACFVG